MDKDQVREVIAKRAAKELHDGDVVHLGLGIPTMIPNYLPEGVTVTLQSETALWAWDQHQQQARKTRTSSTQAAVTSH